MDGADKQPANEMGRPAEETEMAHEHTSRGRAQDRARVAAGQDHEVRYEARKEGVSHEDVQQAVHDVGNSRKKVEARLEAGDEPD